MSLRIQLLLVSLLTLALPWAGCQYVREMENAQRKGYENALLGSASVVASALRDRADLLYRHSELLTAPRDAERDLYARTLPGPVELDGFDDDWAGATDYYQLAPGDRDSSLRVDYLAGVDPRYLYLFLRVRDQEVSYADPGRGSQPHDHAALVLEGPGGERHAYLLETQAPGSITALAVPARTPARRLHGYWQGTATGYQLELRVPLGLIGARLGFAVFDADANLYLGRAGTLPGGLPPSSEALGQPGLLIFPSPELQGALEAFRLEEYREPGKRLRIIDKAGWQLAALGELESSLPAAAGIESPARDLPGPLARFYRLVLGSTNAVPQAGGGLPGRVGGPSVVAALSGQAASAWFRRPGSQLAIVAAAQPIQSRDAILGAVVIEQTSEAILTLTNRALRRLMNVTLLASVVAAAGLLGFATLLSVRIRRLRNAAEHALGPEGQVTSSMPGRGARDELGDLSRSFSTLLERLREHTEYLRTLAGKLSHELRTPLAVVQSSLENLDLQSLPENARTYAGRAREGTARLQAILTAMSEASRVEQSIRGAKSEEFDLAELLAGAVTGYRDVYAARRIALNAPDSPCRMHGVPELVVQLLDKLVDNAVDFSPEGSLIEIELRPERDHWVIAVANEGPALPARMRARLFDSLVSVRERQGERPHLGFGLYIARLIAEFHHGAIEAHNRSGGRGVEFRVRLRRWG